MIKKYRKLPVIIEAVQYDGANLGIIKKWAEESGSNRNIYQYEYSYRYSRDMPLAYTTALVIETLEGEMRANIGDWIIRGISNEFYPCKPDIFKATYEEINQKGK